MTVYRYNDGILHEEVLWLFKDAAGTHSLNYWTDRPALNYTWDEVIATTGVGSNDVGVDLQIPIEQEAGSGDLSILDEEFISELKPEQLLDQLPIDDPRRARIQETLDTMANMSSAERIEFTWPSQRSSRATGSYPPGSFYEGHHCFYVTRNGTWDRARVYIKDRFA
jgi:hypothetical protein